MSTKVIPLLSLILFLLSPDVSSAQDRERDIGSWTSFELKKEINRWTGSAAFELRTMDKLQSLNRWSINANLSYRLGKPIEAGMKYRYITFNDVKYSDLQPRQRYAYYLQGKVEIGRFKFYLREQFQRTVKDERDRIMANGEHDTYSINPEWEWRNRFKIYYNTPKFPINPSFSFETYRQMNNPDGNKFNQLRYTLSFHYKLNKHHKFELYSLANQEINVNNPVTTFVLGLGYTYSFKKTKK